LSFKQSLLQSEVYLSGRNLDSSCRHRLTTTATARDYEGFVTITMDD